ncbi:MAG: putative Ig domain-containing protein [Actinomycetota bacterium]|nr:putative Ig domain-containing protein [Actinomycetota bacterium]
MARRAYVASGVAVGLVLAGAALVSPAQAEKPGAGCTTPALDRPQKAQDLARTNPGAFRAAEVRNAHSVPGLATRARKDSSIWLDRCVDAYYVEEAATAEQKAAAGATMGAEAASSTSLPLASVPLADTFTLESRPGAARTIYLDVTGDTVTGTAWNNSYGSTLTFEPYSIDTTVSTAFSAAELTEIQKMWQVVAEDYAPFDINVTLKDPGTAAIDRTSSSDLVYGARALITNGGTVYDSCGCGGVAYVNVFNAAGASHNYYQPALVFSNGTTKNGKYVGEATSHEVGHNLGLNHDGTSTAGYYSGSAPWAPIMGASYNQPVTQWSKGEYPGANNAQDDLAQIATGAAVRGDEDSGGPVSLANGAAANGVVTRSTDVDSYAFTAAGSTTVSVANGTPFPDLDVQLRVLDAKGAQVALVNPAATRVSATQAAGMSATHTFVAPPSGAVYTAEIRGAGQGTPGTAGAYSTYGSLGTYQVSLSTQLPSDGTPVAVSVGAMPNGAVGTPYAASPVSASGGVAPYTYAASGLSAGLSINPSTGAIGGTPTAAGSFSPVFTVTDSVGATGSSGGSLTVVAGSPLAFATGTTLPGARVRRAYSTAISVTGGTAPYSWALTSGKLPSGMSLSFSELTATVSGTPTRTTKSTFTLRATDADGAVVTRTFSLSVTR